MVNCALLTLHEADSYGAVLQACALQRVLGTLGARSALLSFPRVEPAAASAPAGRGAPPLRWLREAGERRHALFEAFRKEYLVCAPPCPLPRAAELNGAYDCFITGSDQVWNPRVPGVDGRYFLPFAMPEKRFSYAASFGAQPLPEALRPWCGAQLARFRGLSVREESAKALVRALTGREATVCLDPTLLLEPREWEACTQPVEGPPYALLFLLENDAALAREAAALAVRKGLALRVVTASFVPRFGLEAWSGVGVRRWLSLIRCARCVFTDSFHGAVFALLFDRPLRAALPQGALRERGGRVVELLCRAGMGEALKTLCPPPGPARLGARLAEARQVSIEYLRKVVDDAGRIS